MRVVSGEKRGLKLHEIPPEVSCRPTTDRVKESIFNIIRFHLQGNALDLFGGTGQLAIESVSNGCEKAVICDHSPASLKLIRRNVKKAGYEDRITVFDCDYKKFLRHRAQKNEFSLIFVDPPYHTPLAEKSLCYIEESGCLSPDGVIVVETAADENLKERYGVFTLRKKYCYGQIAVRIYEYKTGATKGF